MLFLVSLSLTEHFKLWSEQIESLVTNNNGLVFNTLKAALKDFHSWPQQVMNPDRKSKEAVKGLLQNIGNIL